MECGNHYARSLASWRWSSRRAALSTTRCSAASPSHPPVDGDLTGFVSTGSGWGRVAIGDDGATLTLDAGTLILDRLSVRGQTLVTPTGTIELAAGDSIRAISTTASERASR